MALATHKMLSPPRALPFLPYSFYTRNPDGTTEQRSPPFSTLPPQRRSGRLIAVRERGPAGRGRRDLTARRADGRSGQRADGRRAPVARRVVVAAAAASVALRGDRDGADQSSL